MLMLKDHWDIAADEAAVANLAEWVNEMTDFPEGRCVAIARGLINLVDPDAAVYD